MSMSEIQEAAEIITSAVSPDANIIFGATLKPELEDELIITVIATGFDSEFFHRQEVSLDKNAPKEEITEMNRVSDEAVESVDMNLESESSEEAFANEPSQNIWETPQENDEESDIPAFLRRRKKHKKEAEQSDQES